MTSILITGAASGIGRALALRLAGPGAFLHLGDIAETPLHTAAAACAQAGAQVSARVIDISNGAAMRDWLAGCGRLDLVLACAGIQYTALDGAVETAAQTLRTIEVNLLGTLHTALPALDIMAAQSPDARGMRGQIAVLASQGAFVSVPGASAYCASKAALDNWAVGRAALAARQGIYITSICPGFVRTPMSAINGSMHGLLEPEEAADIIIRQLAKRPVRMVFPWRMYAAARFGGLLPAGFPARMLARKHARQQAAGQQA